MEGDAWTAPGGDYDKVKIVSMSQIPNLLQCLGILTYTATSSSECTVDVILCKRQVCVIIISN